MEKHTEDHLINSLKANETDPMKYSVGKFDIDIVDGNVVIDLSENVGFAVSPETAEKIGGRLIAKSYEARGKTVHQVLAF
ncbi:hypothetical protein PBI_CANTARE_88 [Brevibacterium phage Cantare]|uniref:Uncharacterized protein n=1 Tax=Brevibacterium phage Cantare TaxID=2338395 RepID=A0A3G3LYW2_9CAUD|nr:hypothetical protein PQD70_gp088 [Brevibacterium phage Cantare]AYQ99308.1 hypothetical protein PBI_CANTARE_88 [Brevibacterium phage Cantare]